MSDDIQVLSKAVVILFSESGKDEDAIVIELNNPPALPLWFSENGDAPAELQTEFARVLGTYLQDVMQHYYDFFCQVAIDSIRKGPFGVDLVDENEVH